MNGKVIAFIVVALAVIGVGWYLAQDRSESQTAAVTPGLPPPAAEAPAVEGGVIERDEAVMQTPQVAVPPPPALAESDEPARSAAADLGAKLVAWMTPEEQVRKWVLLVDMAADGKVPAKNRPLVYPMAAFKAEPTAEKGSFRLSDANFGRAGDLVEVLVNMPPQKAADYYRAWLPLLREAYAELGKPDDFDQRLRLAIDRVLAVQPLESTPELARPNVFYTYADPRLEKASDLDKLMWRLGPDNLGRLQTYLREFQAHL